MILISKVQDLGKFELSLMHVISTSVVRVLDFSKSIIENNRSGGFD